MQTGATPGRRVTENINIIHYLIQKHLSRKKKLYILSIDFTKAFDSTDRFKLLQISLEYKMHPHIINIIADTYSNDKTSLFFNYDKVSDINITALGQFATGKVRRKKCKKKKNLTEPNQT